MPGSDSLRWSWRGWAQPAAAAAILLLSLACVVDLSLLVRHCIQLCAVMGGLSTGVYFVLSQGKRYRPIVRNVGFTRRTSTLPKQTKSAAPPSTEKPEMQQQQQSTVFSSSLDSVLREIIDYVIRDYVSTWYNAIAQDKDCFPNLVRADVWKTVEKAARVLADVDWLHFLAIDVVNAVARHLAAVRMATVSNTGEEVEQMFRLHRCVHGGKAESEFLLSFVQCLLQRTLPVTYPTSVRRLLQQVVATAVVKPAVDTLCDPDAFNQLLVAYLSQQEQLAARHKQLFTYAESYEGFMKRIEKCSAISDLKQFRYHIMQELVHATAIQSLRQSEDKDDPAHSPPSGILQKGHLLKTRNLKVYLNQLNLAKSICEKRMAFIGGADYESYFTNEDEDAHLERCARLVPFAVFMQSQQGQEAFLQYLRCYDDGTDQVLFEFWLALEALKAMDVTARYRWAGEVYQKYGRLVQDRSMHKGMETYLIGDIGPDAFFRVQEMIGKQLQDRHYASFVVSNFYQRSLYSVDDDEEVVGRGMLLRNTAVTDGMSASCIGGDATSVSSSEDAVSELFDPDMQTSFVRSEIFKQKLDDLNEKIFNKSQALQGLRATAKLDDPKYERVILDLENTLEALQLERHHLESHKKRDDLWWRNIGKWRATIHSAEMVTEGNKAVPHFVVVVQPSEFAPSLIEHGWVISRTLNDFWALHDHLCMMEEGLSKVQFPARRLPKKSSDDYMERVKELLTVYLSILLKDDRLKQSEPLYLFLSPTPQHIKAQLSAPASSVPVGGSKSPKAAIAPFHIPRIFRKQDGEDEEDELLLFEEEDVAKDITSKSDMVQPLYSLASEIFELHGVFRWFRRTLIHFVQVAYGRSINRQIRETIAWVVSEPMVGYYLRTFRDAFWPGGKQRSAAGSIVMRSNEEKAQTRREARDLLLRNIPEAVRNMFGEETARRGSLKVFEALQDGRLNRHLVYVLSESFLMHLVPELRGPDQKLGRSDTLLSQAVSATVGRKILEPVLSATNTEKDSRPYLPTISTEASRLPSGHTNSGHRPPSAWPRW